MSDDTRCLQFEARERVREDLAVLPPPAPSFPRLWVRSGAVLVLTVAVAFLLGTVHYDDDGARNWWRLNMRRPLLVFADCVVGSCARTSDCATSVRCS